MGVRFPSVFSTTFIGPLPASAAETVICTTPPLSPSLDFASILLFWTFALLAGTGTASVSMAIRRGTTVAGVTITPGSFVQILAAGQNGNVSGSWADTPGAVAGQQYSLTITQNGATAAGTPGNVALIAFAL